MRIIDDLDRPQDGWCLDAVGSGPHIRFDMPLIGHNCKPGLFADEAVQFTKTDKYASLLMRMLCHSDGLKPARITRRITYAKSVRPRDPFS